MFSSLNSVTLYHSRIVKRFYFLVEYNPIKLETSCSYSDTSL